VNFGFVAVLLGIWPVALHGARGVSRSRVFSVSQAARACVHMDAAVCFRLSDSRIRRRQCKSGAP